MSSNPVAHRPLVGHTDPRRRPPTLATFLDSLERTSELDLRLVRPGHGEQIADHRAVIRARFAKQEERGARVLEALANGPSTAHAVARSMWGDVATRQVYLTLSEVLGALDVLLAAGAVREVEGGGGRVLYARGV